VHFGIEAVLWGIAVKAMLRGVNVILGVGWLWHQPSHAFDDVSTPAFDRGLVIAIPSQILASVEFPLPEGLNIWHACHRNLQTIPILDVRATHSGVYFLQHVVIVLFHTLLLDPTLDIYVPFTHCKWVERIVL
jgi:hypothetical protein